MSPCQDESEEEVYPGAASLESPPSYQMSKFHIIMSRISKKEIGFFSLKMYKPFWKKKEHPNFPLYLRLKKNLTFYLFTFLYKSELCFGIGLLAPYRKKARLTLGQPVSRNSAHFITLFFQPNLSIRKGRITFRCSADLYLQLHLWLP